MNLQSCYYFSDEQELKTFFKENPAELKTYSNKMRCCVLLNSKNNLNVKSFNKNTVIRVHDLFTNYLIYENSQGSWNHPEEPVLAGRETRSWVQDIDIWFALPPELENIAKTFGPHVFCFENLKVLKVLSE